MTDKTQAEALRLAEHCETYITFQYDEQVAAELRRLHALAESQRAELVAEAARTAEEKLRADQMTEQHRMQCNMRKELEQKIASLQEELSSRDSWLAECRDAFTLPAVNTELDHHFCSAMTAPSEVPAYVVAQAKALEAQLSAIGAGGVESLRKRDGQQPQAWLVYLPSCDAQNVYDSRDDAGYIDDLTNNDDAVVTPLYAALQAAPPAERCQGCGYLVTQSEHKSCIRAAARAHEHATQLAGQGLEALQEVFKRADRLIDVMDDYDQNAPEHRSYVSGAYEDSLNDLRRAVTAARAAPAQAPFQHRVQPWLLACFGAEIAGDKQERNHRFLEEALELVQSCGCTASEAHQLVDYVFGRPVGEPAQEAGGVIVTLAALCYANGLDMHTAGETELERISVPAMMAKIKAKQAAKPKHSPLPAAPVQAQEDAQIAKLTTAYTELSNMFHDQIVAQQAAWIEWQHGQGAEAAMGWIENGLCGPGHIPDEGDPYGKEAQAWFDANKSDPFPACPCGRPSNILWMGLGFCSNAHYDQHRDAARAAQGDA